MTWGRIDDGFDGHPKRRLGSLAADGLLARAIGHAAKHETDGFVDAAWVALQGTASERRRALREALAARLLEEFPAGSRREIVAPRRPGIRKDPRTVVVGPFEVDGYLIHDFLDYQPAAADLADKRSKERDKKRSSKSTPRLWTGAPVDAVPPGIPPVRGESGLGTSAPSEDGHGDRLDLHAVAPIVAVFADLGQSIDEISVANALARFPGRDHLAAARGCAEYLRQHPDKPAGHTFHRYLEREKPQTETGGSERRSAALRDLVQGAGG